MRSGCNMLYSIRSVRQAQTWAQRRWSSEDGGDHESVQHSQHSPGVPRAGVAFEVSIKAPSSALSLSTCLVTFV